VQGLKSYETAWVWLHKIRTAMVRSDRTKLSGIFEVDDFYLGGEEHSGSTGRGTENKVLVVAAIELQDNGKLWRTRICIDADASKKSLVGFIKSNIDKGSTVIADGWASYASLPNEGYGHEVYIQKKA
jgi:hypothetical protein